MLQLWQNHWQYKLSCEGRIELIGRLFDASHLKNGSVPWEREAAWQIIVETLFIQPKPAVVRQFCHFIPQAAVIYDGGYVFKNAAVGGKCTNSIEEIILRIESHFWHEIFVQAAAGGQRRNLLSTEAGQPLETAGPAVEAKAAVGEVGRYLN